MSQLAHMKSLLLLLILCLVVPLAARATESESMTDHTLRQLVERQKELLAEAAKENPHFDEENFKLQMQQVCQGYDTLLRENPDYAPGYAAYGYLLGKIGMRKASIAMLLKSNAAKLIILCRTVLPLESSSGMPVFFQYGKSWLSKSVPWSVLGSSGLYPVIAE